MSSISSEEIISILKSEIENYELETKDQEVGTVIWISDGITTVYGIDHAMYGEIVIFETGVKGMVQDIRRNEIGVILLGKDTGIKEGTKVTRTGKKAGIPVGDAYLGRVVDALGAPIDGKGDIPSDGLNKRHLELLIVNQSVFRLRQESWQLTLCSRLDADRES